MIQEDKRLHGKVIMAGRRLLSLTAMIMLLVILYGCGRYKPVSADAGRMGEAASGQEEIARGKIRTAVEMLETGSPVCWSAFCQCRGYPKAMTAISICLQRNVMKIRRS